MSNTNERKKKFEIFKIRLKLLKIWFLKNLSIFVKIGIFMIATVLVSLIVFGVKEFGIVPTVAKFLVQENNGEQLNLNWTSIPEIIASLISILLSIFYVYKKAQTLSINDIKSRDLKIALIKAKLYFDENGKICKRVEESTQMDINGDGKIGDTNIEDIPSTNVLAGAKTALGELKTILTTDIDLDDKVVEDAKLNDAIDEADEDVTTDKLYTETIGAPVVEIDEDAKTLEDKLEEIGEPVVVVEDEEVDEEEKHHKHHRFRKHKEKPEKEHKEHDGAIYLFFKDIFDAFKDSKLPKLEKEEKPIKPKREKHKKRDKDMVEKKRRSRIEVVNVEDEQPTATTKTSKTANKEETTVTQTTTTTTTVVKTSKERQIDDILSSL